jgi:hypothetical protein
VTNGGAGQGVRRLFGTNLSSGKVYFSALFRVNDLGYGTWNGASTYEGALTATNNTSFQLSWMIKSNSPTGYVIGLSSLNSGGGPNVFDTTEHTAGETVFLVGRYDFTTTPNTIALWINPSSATFGAASEPATGFIQTNPMTDGLSIDRFNMRQNTASSVPAAMHWDELRFGNTWADVTPVALPIAVTLTDVEKLGDGAFQFAYTNGSGQDCTVHVSTNLIDWTSVGPATQVSPGWYQFTDTTATNFPRRFYQLRSPGAP